MMLGFPLGSQWHYLPPFSPSSWKIRFGIGESQEANLFLTTKIRAYWLSYEEEERELAME